MKIGIDIGGSHIGAGLVNKCGELISKESRDINIICLNFWIFFDWTST